MLGILAVIMIHSSPFDELPQKSADFTLKGGKTIVLNQIQFVGNKAVSTKELQELTNTYLNRAISESDLSAMEGEIKSYYERKGYKGTLVSIPSKPKGGVLVIQIKESQK